MVRPGFRWHSIRATLADTRQDASHIRMAAKDLFVARQPLFKVCPTAGIELGPGFLQSRPEVAAAIAYCIALWSDVEIQMARLLAAILEANTKPAAALFLSLRNSRAQNDALSAAAQAMLDTKLLKLFDAILKMGGAYQSERNALVHGIFGKSDAIPDGVLWMHSQDRIGHMIYTDMKATSGNVTIADHLLIKEKIYVYTLKDLEILASQIMEYHKLVYDFISLISRKDGPPREDLFLQLCERANVSGGPG